MIICAVLVVVGLAVTLLLIALTGKPHKTLTDVAPAPATATAPTADSPSPLSQSKVPPRMPALPVTDDPSVYARAVARDLFDVEPAAVSRQQFLTFWEQNLPTVVYSDAATKGLTLADQNADVIDNLTHGWIPTEAGWRAEAANATVSKLTITSIAVPDYWINAIAAGRFYDPGLHLERVMGILTQTYGSSVRYTARRAIVIDLGLLCGPTQPGGCRLLAPQLPPEQAGTTS
jgi:hypothetical protein